MLQAAKTERISARRSYPGLPVLAQWDIERNNPTIDDSDLTGGYERESGAFVFYDRMFQSLAQTTYQGTGGNPLWAETMQQLASASGAYIVVQHPPQMASSVDPAAFTPIDVGKQLAFARHYLSLNTTDLSRILHVERPTIYAWLDRKWDPKLENKGRIRRLYQVARRWREMFNRPIGKLVRESVDGDASLMDHLIRDKLEEAAINRVLAVIRELADRKSETKQVRSVREIARRRGFKPLSSTQENERFDRMTRF
jgi:hypothetical protein